MKRRRALMIAGVMIALAMLGGAAFFCSVHPPMFEVRYGGALADKSDVRRIRQIVSRERWAVLWTAIRHRDALSFRRYVRQLAFGRLRLISGDEADFTGLPTAVVYYDDSRNKRYWAEFTLHHQNDRWTLYGYSYLDARFYARPDLP